MTALAANRNTAQLSGLGRWPSNLTVKDLEVLYSGAMLAIDSTPEVVEASDASALKVVGRSPAYIDNSDDGEVVSPDLGVFKWENDISNPVLAGESICFVKDDQTVCATAGSTHKVVAGLVVAVESDGVWVAQTFEALRAATALHNLGDTSASDHIADPAAQTQNALTLTAMTGTANTAPVAEVNTTALTDSGGGTADGTVSAQAAPITVTDSSGLHASHDDEIAAATPANAITDNGGGADPGDHTIASITNSANAGSADIAPTTAAIAQLAAKQNTTTTAIGVLAQNGSDLGQKLIELVTLAATAQDNLKEVTTELAKQRTLNAVLVNDAKTFATELNAVKADLASSRTAIVSILAALETQEVVKSA